MKKFKRSTPQVCSVKTGGTVTFTLHDRMFLVDYFTDSSAPLLGKFTKRLNFAEIHGYASVMQFGQMGGLLDYICAIGMLMDVVRKGGGLYASM